MTNLRLPVRVVCLVPVRNEAWILRQFLTATSLWADNIIIADQQSTDGSREIAATFDRVTLIRNASSDFNEGERQRMLIAEARKLPGPKVLVALDADELLSPELIASETILALYRSGPGSVIRVPLVNLSEHLRFSWVGYAGLGVAWYDNGREHRPDSIHSRRLPVLLSDPEVRINGAALLHLQFLVGLRMRSKHRWYLSWERVHRHERDAVSIYRQYHHMDGIRQSDRGAIPVAWLTWYKTNGIDLSEILDDGFHWWDAEVLSRLETYGTRYFAREAIWDFDWVTFAKSADKPNPDKFSDPRGILLKSFHSWLKGTQLYSHLLPVRAVDKVLRKIS